MAFTALNIPYSNGNSHFVHFSHQAPHSHLEAQFRTERGDKDTFSHHPPYSDRVLNQNDIPASLDSAVANRPTGVTTTALSPFPEVGGGQPYTSDGESETGTESDSREGDETTIEQHHKFGEPAALSQSPLLQRQVAQVTSSDPLETSLESHSRHSSVSEFPQLLEGYDTRAPPVGQGHHTEGYSMNLNSQHFHFEHDKNDSETNGRFTSASATPNSQQKVLVNNQTRQESIASLGEVEGKVCTSGGAGEVLRRTDERKVEVATPDASTLQHLHEEKDSVTSQSVRKEVDKRFKKENSCKKKTAS